MQISTTFGVVTSTGRIIVERDEARDNVIGLWIRDEMESLYTEVTPFEAKQLIEALNNAIKEG